LFGKFDATIFRAAVFGGVVSNRLGLPETFGGEPRSGNSVSNQPSQHGLGALLRERLIRRGISLIVRVPFDAQFQIRVLLQQLDDFTEDLPRVRQNDGLTSVKMNAVDRNMAALLDFVRKTRRVRSHFLLHLFNRDDCLVVKRAFVVDVEPRSAFVSDDLAW
jgi:hypothetical protein